MYTFMSKKPLQHALVWIGVYIVLVNIGDAIAESMGFAFATAILVLALSLILIIYLLRNREAATIGLKQVRQTDFRATLYYLPLVLLVAMQWYGGVNPALTAVQLGSIILLMIGVGLVEEAIFRGLLYRAIEQKSGVNRAVIISGITFGLGHLVNLLRGFTTQELVGQIVAAVAIGIVLALLVAVTGNIVPGIVFHICYNIGGSTANVNQGSQMVLLAVTLGICVLYGLYLVRRLPQRQALLV